MFVTGPDVHPHGDARGSHAKRSSAARRRTTRRAASRTSQSTDDRECLQLIRELLGVLPSNNLDEAPRARADRSPDREDEALDRLVPESPNQPYDMHDVIHAIVDDGGVSRSARSTSRATSSLASRGWVDAASASSPISPRILPARSTSTRR